MLCSLVIINKSAHEPKKSLYSDVSDMIKALYRSKLAAECPYCGDEFQLSKSLLFDGRGDFPPGAEERRSEMLNDLKKRSVDLLKKKKRATTESEKLTVAIGVGKIIEKTLPAHRNFDLVPADCRFLAEPIDMIVFDGISKNKVKKITFLDVKTGNSTLEKHQKQIRDTIQDHDVRWASY